MRSILLLLLLALAGSARAQINLYVDSSVTASGAGNSWSAAFKTLSEALHTANAGSTTSKYVISVAKGTYYPAGSASDTTRDSAFSLFRGGIKLYGGYPNGGGSTRNLSANKTVLSGEIRTSSANDNSFHIMIMVNVAASMDSIVVNGFDFTGAAGNVPSSRTINTKGIFRNGGGGIYVTDVLAACEISDCNFYNNRVNYSGGGIYVSDGRVNIVNCSFDNNQAGTYPDGEGGGLSIYNWIPPAVVRNCSFSNNTAGAYGGAFHTYHMQPLTVSNCSFTQNTAGQKGGAADEHSNGNNSSSSWENCDFTANRVNGYFYYTSGGAYYGSMSAAAIMRNCNFTRNYAIHEAGGAYAFNMVFSKCVFDGNTTTGDGGGAWLTSADSCVFRNNKAGLTGGGAYLYNGTITNSSFTADTAGVGGGGIYSRYQSEIRRCRIEKNVATYGGGIYAFDGNNAPAFRQNIISGNIALSNGGGIYTKSLSFIASNCLISGNKAGSKGGAIFDSSASPTITNCTLAGDTAATGNGIYNTNAAPVIRNSIIWEGPVSIFDFNNSTPTVSYSIIGGGYSGTGNSSSDPLFVAPLAVASIPDTGGNFDILPCSPAVNSGSNTLSTDTSDVLRRTRIIQTTIDRGAFESPLVYPVQLGGSGTVCVNDTIRLNTAIPGGSWASSNTAVATVDASGLVTGVAAGSSTITYTQGSGSCPYLAARNITIYPANTVTAISGRSLVCENDTIRLSNATTGGTWTNLHPTLGSVTSAGVYSATGGGTDTVFYTVVNANGCRAVASSIITLNALPVVAAITGKSGICPQDTITLLNATSGGVWSNAHSTVSSVSATGLVTALSPGTDTIRYTVTSAQGCSTRVRLTLTVHPLPVVTSITGKNSLCLNDTTTLRNATTGGIWSNNDTTIIDLQSSGLTTGLRAGKDTIRYTIVSTNGCSNSAEYPVTVHALPALSPISGPGSVCMYTTAALSVTPAGGIWSSSDNNVLRISGAGVMTPVSGGNAALTYTFTNTNGCSAAASTTVSVAAIDSSVTVSGIQFTANQGGAGYQWLDCSSGNTPIPGAVGQTYTAAANGSYAVQVNYNGCTAISGCYTVQGLSVNGAATAGSITIVPNPAADMAIVRFPDAVHAAISVRDISGKLLHAQQCSGVEATLDLRTWAPGMYFIEARTAVGVYSSRLHIVR